MVMGYHAQRHYEGVRAMLSAGGNLTVDVVTGSNEASTIVAGGKVDLRGTWENKSDYDIFSRSWVALDEAIANMDGKVDERWAEGEHMHLSSMDRIEYDGMDAMADGSLAQPRREAVWDYTENELGFDEDAIAIGTGWLAMQATVPFAGVADESYLRFRLIEDYKEDVVHERGIIDGHGGTNVTLLDDDYGVSWAGQGGAEVASLHNLWKPLTGLSPGTKTVAPINAAASVTHLDLSGLAVPHSPVAELAVNVATPVAPDVNLAITLGDLDSAPQVGLDVLQSRLPTTSTLPQVQEPLGQNVTFTLSGYEPLTSLPPGNVPTPDGTIGGSGAGLPGYVFTSSSFGPNPTTGTLPDYYRDGNTLNGYTPTEPDTGTLPNVTLSQSLLEKLTAGPSTLGPLLNTDVLRQNVRETLDLEPESTFDPDALREASAESSAHLLRTQLTDSLDPTVDIKLGDLVDDEVRQSLAELNTLGAFGGKSVIDFAGPMLNEGSEGVNVLETLDGPPELKDIIAQRHEYYLQQEAELKLKREDWVNQKLLEEYFGDMGHNGWMPEMTPKERAELIAELRANPMFASLIADLETKALDEVGRSHYELIKAQTDAQKQRLHLEMFPPPPPPEPKGGFFSSIFGMIVLAIVAIVLSVVTYGAAIAWFTAAGGGVISTLGTVAAVAVSGGMTARIVSTIQSVASGMGFWDTFKTSLKAAAIGSVTAVATWGVGHGLGLDKLWQAGPNFNVPGINQVVDGVQYSRDIFLTELTLKPLLHGIVQGSSSTLQGGKFESGFASGFLSSMAGPFIDGLGAGEGMLGQFQRGLAGAVVGAGGAALTDGNIAQGAIQGAVVQMFNDFLSNRNGVAHWVVEEDGTFYNKNMREVPVGQIIGGQLYLSPKFGGGTVPASQAATFVGKFWNEYPDISKIAPDQQDKIIKFAFDRMKEGRPITSDSVLIEYSRATIAGLKTGGKAVVNSAGKTVVGFATLGTKEGGVMIPVTQEDIDAGYYQAEMLARIGTETGFGLVTGAVSALSKGGQMIKLAGGAIKVLDAGGNIVGVYQGADEIIKNGLNWSNAAQVIAGTLGVTADAAGDIVKAWKVAGKTETELAVAVSDASRKNAIGAAHVDEFKIDPGTLSGPRTKISANDDAETIRSLSRENESADVLAKHGANVEQNPNVAGSSNPDYKINGEIYDNYAPSTNTSVRNVWTEVRNKVVVKQQTERVVLNLDDWGGEPFRIIGTIFQIRDPWIKRCDDSERWRCIFL